ncbi:hypothetical protein AB205_0031420 [Aquarana catesbeiana]|uniref:Uncharacterized protein n=1 Tax=Aquarana catesbeiana TaxID=8400 RepID=A0A2G9RFE5_AQUCT|nr:hypothetical protein AB205_0031420 [Aquarana catesbeiana]
METLTTPSGYSETSESKSIKPTAVGKLKKCGHIFHQLCMFEMYSNGNKVLAFIFSKGLHFSLVFCFALVCAII